MFPSFMSGYGGQGGFPQMGGLQGFGGQMGGFPSLMDFASLGQMFGGGNPFAGFGGQGFAPPPVPDIISQSTPSPTPPPPTSLLDVLNLPPNLERFTTVDSAGRMSALAPNAAQRRKLERAGVPSGLIHGGAGR